MPSANGTRGSKPRSARAREISAKVCRTSADRFDQLRQHYGAGIAQIIEIQPPASFRGPHDAVGDVFHIGVIAPCGAVAEHGDGHVVQNQAAELGDGQIRAVPRPIGREKPQAGEVQAIQMMESGCDQFAGPLAGGVGADGRVDVLRLVERSRVAVAVHRRA